ncbi:Fibrillin-1 MP340 [Collichthys lucidus]|uniref:Fibrillin-1 MP340 n=1 Tax=Collichthys lucidus TaxID=240159 RepID=A0A4U5U9A1_COLLU|nr:Fibrillin-1 MP340 [Collichthys lucidus]
MELLAALVALLCIHAPVCGAEGCSDFRHLENGQTFFRYGGLLVIFRCYPGYKLHGYKTNSCVSGHWSRDTPVCVGSGCSNPGTLTHGTSSMNEDGSWAMFSCNNGFHLHGPSVLYCKGHTWNSTKPVCKESDMMGSISGVNLQKPNIHQNLQAPVVLKTQQQSHYDSLANTASKEANFKLGLFFKSKVRSKQLIVRIRRQTKIKEQKQELEGMSQSPSSTQSNMRTQPLNVTFPANTITTTKPPKTENHNLTINTTSNSRRPVCLYPPVPAHGTFYFRNVDNPGPREYKHYIQYACYPGYTLAHGDIHSYCQQGGTWSGITPVCLELTPCSVNNGGCSQLCSHSQHYNQSSNQTQARTRCHCKPGFTLLDDGRTCRDLDECVEGQHQCQQRCINTFGSFKCGCDDGFQPAHDQTSCTDVDECLLPVTGCVFGCVNTPGSFHCQCPAGYSLEPADSHCQDIDECFSNHGLGPCMEQCHNSPGSYQCSCTYGHILAGNGHSCIAECPPGYRKGPATTAENKTAHVLKEQCEDINECEEEGCEGQCLNLPGSHRCICPKGYRVQSDGRRCKDINECSRKNGGCSHLCVNQKGGHKCACPATHRLSPYSWKKCLPRTTTNTAG